MARPRIDPAVWHAPPAPSLTGAFAVNDRLAVLERWSTLDGSGPEDIAFDREGRLVCGLEDGRILRFPRGGGVPEVLASTGGRPGGIEVAHDGALIVCDFERGLLRVDVTDGSVTVLVDQLDGRQLHMVDNADIDPDGRIYFSEATRFTWEDHLADFFEHRGHGKLHVHEPATGETRTLVESLFFANGVALDPDGAFVLVAETARYRIQRLWLAGPRAGELEPFVENLPGMPDNINATEDGRFWVGFVQPRDANVDRVMRYPGLRRVIYRLPEAVRPGPKPFALVACFDRDGRVVDQLQDPQARYPRMTTAIEHDGWLYVGSLEEDAVGRVKLG